MNKIDERKMMADRLYEVVSACGLTMTDFFSELGISYASSYISQIRSGRSGISPKVRKLIVSHYPRINIDYILKGSSPMFLKEPSDKFKVVEIKKNYLPYFPLPESSINNRTMKNWRENQSEQISVPTFMNCTCYADCHKKSMTPVIEVGDIMALEKVKNSHLRYGEIFYLVTKMDYYLYRVVKNENEELVDLIPTNENYSKVTIKIEDIEEAFQVRGIIRRV